MLVTDGSTERTATNTKGDCLFHRLGLVKRRMWLMYISEREVRGRSTDTLIMLYTANQISSE